MRKVVETVRVESAEKLEITFKDGNRKVVSLSERGDSRLTTLLR